MPTFVVKKGSWLRLQSLGQYVIWKVPLYTFLTSTRVVDNCHAVHAYFKTTCVVLVD